jgi:chemotaxis protein MotB
MKKTALILSAAMACAWPVFSGCVTNGTHEAVLKDLENTKKMCAEAQSKLTKERDDLAAAKKSSDDSLAMALDQKQILETKVSSMGQNVAQLLGEKGQLSSERERLLAEQNKLSNEVEEMKRMRAAAEARNAEYRTVLEKLHKMIDAGTLQVKIRNGRMLVQMSSDVVFPPGGVAIKKEAKEAIVQLADTIKMFPDRKFQVVGHSDSNPIRTERFPSNWELSSQRAVEVVKLMVDSGVPPEMISAGGNAEFDPLVQNDSPENKTLNRRVEIVFLPKIDELPGFDRVLSGSN